MGDTTRQEAPCVHVCACVCVCVCVCVCCDMQDLLKYGIQEPLLPKCSDTAATWSTKKTEQRECSIKEGMGGIFSEIKEDIMA